MESFDTAIINMLSNDKYSKNALFYAHIISQLNVEKDLTLNAPAGVKDLTLYINPEIFEKFSLNDRIFILIHESLHIIFKHQLRFKDFKDCKDCKDFHKWNIATDKSINQLIKLPAPEGCLFPNKDEKLFQNAEYYYNSANSSDNSQTLSNTLPNMAETSQTLSNTLPNMAENSQVCETLPNMAIYRENAHSKWSSNNDEIELNSNLIDNIVVQSYNKTLENLGNIPKEIDELVKKITSKTIKWQKVLRNIVANKRTSKKFTLLRKNRRFPLRNDLKGKKSSESFDLSICIDVSGSVDDEILGKVISEIETISKLNDINLRYFQLDTKVHEITNIDFNNFKRKGKGGTYMFSCIKYLKENKINPDCLIFLTDGYIEDLSLWTYNPKYKVIFLSWNKDIKVYKSNFKSFKIF